MCVYTWVTAFLCVFLWKISLSFRLVRRYFFFFGYYFFSLNERTIFNSISISKVPLQKYTVEGVLHRYTCKPRACVEFCFAAPIHRSTNDDFSFLRRSSVLLCVPNVENFILILCVIFQFNFIFIRLHPHVASYRFASQLARNMFDLRKVIHHAT